MSAQGLERVLARLYTEPEFRERFLADPARTLRDDESIDCLTPEERQDLAQIDRAGLVMAAHSFAHKRERRR